MWTVSKYHHGHFNMMHLDENTLLKTRERILLKLGLLETVTLTDVNCSIVWDTYSGAEALSVQPAASYHKFMYIVAQF